MTDERVTVETALNGMRDLVAGRLLSAETDDDLVWILEMLASDVKNLQLDPKVHFCDNKEWTRMMDLARAGKVLAEFLSGE